VSTPILNGLGQALRWLRDRQGKKQYQVADTAGITKGMLSAYETGRQRPSLETLEKILDTLGCDLNDLHNAIQIINGRPEKMKRRGEGAELVG
jgi:transcriptional regulator with XRE-family HTH domain